MSELLSAAASSLGVPEPLVQRAAEARAAASGTSVDAVLAAWAGGESVAPAPTPKADASGEVTTEPETSTPPAEAVEEVPAPTAEPSPPAATVPASTPAPPPQEVTPAEAAHLPVVVTVPTAQIKERTSFVVPKWLTAVLLAAPLIALFALGGSATGECGTATELTIDVVTGEVRDCDGSPFAGAGGGGGETDFIALGEAIYQGTEVTGVNCAACHAPNGQGVGPFPALTGVLTTFGSCADQIEWIQLGSAGFVAAGRDTYGDTGKTINGGMPGHSSLTAEQLAAVAAFERVRFGRGDAETVLADCGLAEAPEEDAPSGDGGMGDATEGSGEASRPTRDLG